MAVRRTAALLLAALIVAGCSAEPGGEAAGAATPAPIVKSPAKSGRLAWATPATGQGEKGNPLEITPVGVYYHPGDAQYGKSKNGMFLAVGVKVTATGEADQISAPFTGHGFRWEGGGETITSAEGGQPPWVGRVNTPISQDIQAGDYAAYVITFDVPERGGTLTYLSADGTQQRWAVPARSGGQGLKKVLAALDELGINR
ncbi:hypothetical protein ACQP10_37935 (plasmid) [Streptosporangium sandarakinum]|uniref:hypothetical protein n=1 Tax=Streptosporangium sandarakinum TaxID=1260955 RepID=UPI003D8E4D8E